ncbi:EF-hand calcium-binding domain-containing protein 7 [Nymphon striatum]|nr:EF-hand calcium-binding domain-containing protein 7 [Nymphon striatum]
MLITSGKIFYQIRYPAFTIVFLSLCIAGRNPTLSQVNSLWTGSAIDLKEFCQIVPKIDAVSEGKLSVAFSKLSPKKQNSMPKDQLTSILTSCGEALSTNDVKIFLECVTQTNPEVIDKSGEVSYQKLISVLVTAAKDARNNSVNKFDLQNKPSPLKRMASGSRRRRSSIALQKMPEAPSNIQHWIKTSVKGSFFFDDDKKDIISHQYQMEVPEDSSVYITVKSRLGDFEKQQPEHGEIDTRIFILSEEDNSFKLYSFTHEKNDKVCFLPIYIIYK